MTSGYQGSFLIAIVIKREDQLSLQIYNTDGTRKRLWAIGFMGTP